MVTQPVPGSRILGLYGVNSIGGDFRVRLVTEIRFDLIFNHRFVSIHRALANSEDHIFVDPSVESFAERHIRILGEVGNAVISSVRFEQPVFFKMFRT